MKCLQQYVKEYYVWNKFEVFSYFMNEKLRKLGKIFLFLGMTIAVSLFFVRPYLKTIEVYSYMLGLFGGLFLAIFADFYIIPKIKK